MERFDRNSFDAQGECPICGSGFLIYEDPEIDGNYVSYNWTCNSCESQGIERYELGFCSQVVHYDGHKGMSTDDEKRERKEI